MLKELLSLMLIVAVLIGFNKSVVLLTLPSPTIADVIPVTVPVNAGDANGAFRSNAVCVAVLIGFNNSVVLLAFPSPTIADVIPDTVPVDVGDAMFALVVPAMC